jgi:hypothetical protein
MGPDAIDGGEHLAIAQGRRERAVMRRSLDLKLHEAVERDRRRDLALDEGVHIADVPGRDGREAERTAGITPGESGRDVNLPPIADSMLRLSPLRLNCDKFDHSGPPC